VDVALFPRPRYVRGAYPPSVSPNPSGLSHGAKTYIFSVDHAPHVPLSFADWWCRERWRLCCTVDALIVQPRRKDENGSNDPLLTTHPGHTHFYFIQRQKKKHHLFPAQLAYSCMESTYVDGFCIVTV